MGGHTDHSLCSLVQRAGIHVLATELCDQNNRRSFLGSTCSSAQWADPPISRAVAEGLITALGGLLGASSHPVHVPHLISAPRERSTVSGEDHRYGSTEEDPQLGMAPGPVVRQRETEQERQRDEELAVAQERVISEQCPRE